MTSTIAPPIPLCEIRDIAEQLARMFLQRHHVEKDQLPLICAAAGEILSVGLVKKLGAFRVRPYIERSLEVAPSINHLGRWD